MTINVTAILDHPPNHPYHSTMLLDRPVVSFDIETIPDPTMGRRALDLAGSDAEVVREMVRLRSKETEGRTEYPALPWHRVVGICATVLDPKTGEVQIRALGADLHDERSVLRGFFELVTRELDTPRLASWNGSGYDLPVIGYRSMVHGISAPSFYRRDGDRKWNNYQNRFHDLHVDVMDVMSSYGSSTRAGLGAWAQSVGLPGKSFLEKPIYEHVVDGELELVIEYCKLDTVETLLALLSWAHHIGDATTADVRRCVGGARDAIATLDFEGWRDVEACLRDWPAWAGPSA